MHTTRIERTLTELDKQIASRLKNLMCGRDFKAKVDVVTDGRSCLLIFEDSLNRQHELEISADKITDRHQQWDGPWVTQLLEEGKLLELMFSQLIRA